MSKLRILTPKQGLLYSIDVKSKGRVTREGPEKCPHGEDSSSVKGAWRGARNRFGKNREVDMDGTNGAQKERKRKKLLAKDYKQYRYALSKYLTKIHSMYRMLPCRAPKPASAGQEIQEGSQR
jgi:hypothetical protein